MGSLYSRRSRGAIVPTLREGARKRSRSSGASQGDTQKLKLDKDAVSPIRTGMASCTNDMGGGTMSITFLPLSEKLAKMTTVVRMGSKQIVGTVMLERERTVRRAPK